MFMVSLLLITSLPQSPLQFTAPQETLFAGATVFSLETDVPEEEILGLELFVNGVSAFYFEKKPFETKIDMSRYPAGPVKIKAVLTLFGDQIHEAVLEGRNIPNFEQENVQLVRVPVTLEQSKSVKLEDFTLLEDGKHQKIEMLYDQEKPMQLVVVLDLSGSMENFLPCSDGA